MATSYSYTVRLANSLCLKTNFQNAISHRKGNFYATIITTDIDADILSFIYNPEMAHFSQKGQEKQVGSQTGHVQR
jgi:hypothetical protein